MGVLLSVSQDAQKAFRGCISFVADREPARFLIFTMMLFLANVAWLAWYGIHGNYGIDGNHGIHGVHGF